MKSSPAEIVVAGHICLDIIPELPDTGARLDQLLAPGRLTAIGPATVSTGGAVSNTGLALHRLGVPVRLLSRVGDDLLGQTTLACLRRQGDHLAEGMVLASGEASSYTVVLSPPGLDRMFLHCAGTNDTFSAADVTRDHLHDARLFHFGYPPLHRRLIAGEGQELEQMLLRVKEAGLTVSLDMVFPDPASPAGQADWTAILKRCLPFVDVFLPSVEELLFMIDRPAFDRMDAQPGGPVEAVTRGDLGRLADTLIGWGVPVVVIKCGHRGLYLKAAGRASAFQNFGRARPDRLADWTGQELTQPCFQTRVAGTTGAGDATIAGFLAAMVKGHGPRESLARACAVGAFNVEALDAVSGVPDWDTMERRLAACWPTLAPGLDEPDMQG